MEPQKTLNRQSSRERKMKGTGGIGCPDFRLYYKAMVIKRVWHWHNKKKYRRVKQDRKPEITPHTYGHLVYDKGVKNIQ